MAKIGESELILNPDGSIYHLKLRPENIADTIILVGDQDRVEVISAYFDKIEFKVQNREFTTHTGYYRGKRLSVLSTGIGTDNIDIVLNELDALVNIDLQSREVKKEHKALNFIRIGTSGALQEDIPVDTPLFSKVSVGFDGLLNFYADRNQVANVDAESLFKEQMNWNPLLASPYFVSASELLFNKLASPENSGITISAPGFYGPQGRILRLDIQDPEINEKLSNFSYNGLQITNYEMESSALYGLSALLGHNALTVCNIIANRKRKAYSKDYKKSLLSIIENILDKLSE